MINKMFEDYGVRKYYRYYLADNFDYTNVVEANDFNYCSEQIKKLVKSGYVVYKVLTWIPQFTLEKRDKLEELILKTNTSLALKYFDPKFPYYQEKYKYLIIDKDLLSEGKTRDNALASLMSNIKDVLSSEEQAEVKMILEG